MSEHGDQVGSDLRFLTLVLTVVILACLGGVCAFSGAQLPGP